MTGNNLICVFLIRLTSSQFKSTGVSGGCGKQANRTESTTIWTPKKQIPHYSDINFSKKAFMTFISRGPSELRHGAINRR